MFCPDNHHDDEHAFLCLSAKHEIHWFWIVLPLILLTFCLIYIFSRPNYVRVSSRIDLLPSSSNAIPAVRSVLDQCLDHTKTLLPNHRRQEQLSNTGVFMSMKNGSRRSIDQAMNNSNEWREFRTPTIANYPDLIDATEVKRIHSASKQPLALLSNDLRTLIERSAAETDGPLGRLWFFLEYNPYLRELYLTVVKARQLRSINACAPTTFVRAELIPSANETLTTDVVRNTCNPDYLTEMVFHLNLVEFSEHCLKLTVHQVDRDVFHTPIGTVYYPLDHLLIAQRAKGHMVWRNLLPDYGDPAAIGLIQIRATVWYDAEEEYLNIYVHSLRATGLMEEAARVYVHASVAIKDAPILPQEHLEASELSNQWNNRSQRGPSVIFNDQDETLYDQLFRFVIYKAEFNEMTVVLDVFRRSIGDMFYNDVLLGRTVLASSQLLEKNAVQEKNTNCHIDSSNTRVNQ